MKTYLAFAIVELATPVRVAASSPEEAEKLIKLNLCEQVGDQFTQNERLEGLTEVDLIKASGRGGRHGN
jgi:hypothetical protein